MAAPSDIDVVIIGSGFGGSITANRLAQAGQRVLVLERGPWRDTLPVRSMGVERVAPLPYGTKALTHLLRSLHMGRWGLNLNKSGLFEFRSYRGLSVLCASGVGGGSMTYGGLLEPPRDPGYWQGRHPELDPGLVERHYGKILTDMGAFRFERSAILPQTIWDHLPTDGERRCRPAAEQPHMALNLPGSPEETGRTTTTEHGVQRQYCAFDGDSFLGSRGGAKASVDFIYLAPVLGKGARVRDLCEVTSIRRNPEDGGGYTVHFRDLATRAVETVRASRVVLAAGTMNSLRLLFSSSGEARGLAPMPALGRTFGANGDLPGTLAGNGQASSFSATPSLGAFAVDNHPRSTLGLGGFPGLDTLPLPGPLKRRLGRTFFMYGMGADSGSGTVGFSSGRLQVDYDQRREPVYDEIRAAFRVLEAETGRKAWAIGKPLTLHPWGGARLGPNPDEGVVDHRGEVYGNPGLFVADASALPAAAGGAPSLAIAAWAHHVAVSMTAADGRVATAA